MKLTMLQMESLCTYYWAEAFSWTFQPPGTAQAVKNCQNSSKGATSNSPCVVESHAVWEQHWLVQYHLFLIQQDTGHS